ncbi:AcrZ family multidrug efflux pump-associated protein [Pectobacterium cacticida]|uniref:Multidrug efflux pump accessory protein AcrZ n=1 Tax=Pectobacterium cacticida TaxID=69221 RepID=A0ABZ2GG79_9GAMM|nr:AcrZ family multidrug efflux pump-associated protein [Pectobacterium cacticida]UYX05722.1 AcrZ family multidrug efflux pump-associated protein [Pectobacterium cacticida]
MLELLKSLLFAVAMVPVMMVVIMGAIYCLGELFNVLSRIGHADDQRAKN